MRFVCREAVEHMEPGASQKFDDPRSDKELRRFLEVNTLSHYDDEDQNRKYILVFEW